MKKHNFFFFLFWTFLFLFPINVQAEFHKDSISLQAFEKKIETRISEIDHKVNMGNETLKAAKEYSQNANSIHIWAYRILALFVAIFVGTTVAYIRSWINGLKLKKEEELNKYKRQIARLVDTESTTIYIKDNTQVLRVLKSNSSNKNKNEFLEVTDAILRPFNKKPFDLEVANLEEIKERQDYKSFLKFNSNLKIVIMNDDLLGNTDPSTWKNNAKLVFSDLIQREIGFIVYGRTRLDGSGMKYRTGANMPPTLFGNVNNLLKYMVAGKKIKTN